MILLESVCVCVLPSSYDDAHILRSRTFFKSFLLFFFFFFETFSSLLKEQIFFKEEHENDEQFDDQEKGKTKSINFPHITTNIQLTLQKNQEDVRNRR